MRSGRYVQEVYGLILCVMGCVTFALHVPCCAAVPEGILRYYEVKIEMFSIQPDRVLDSYVGHGGGMATVNSTVGLACKDELRDFSARIQPRQKDGHLLAEVTITPNQSDTETVGKAFQVDLSTLEPKAVKLGQNDDGRAYVLNLTPTVKIVDITPKRADETAFEFNKWVFQDSVVIVNDRLYVGKLNASGGYRAYMDIADVGKFEFAMQPFRGAQLLGTLAEGRIRMECEDGTTIEIHDVKNGIHEMQLPGGPYGVWVRRSPSAATAKYEVPTEEEWIQQVKAGLAEKGLTPPSDKELHSKYEHFKSMEPRATMGFGIGPIPEADKVK